jgi:hypothetical protein
MHLSQTVKHLMGSKAVTQRDPSRGRVRTSHSVGAIQKAAHKHGGPTSFMMESVGTMGQNQQDASMKRSDLDRIRTKMGQYVQSLPSQRKMNHQ